MRILCVAQSWDLDTGPSETLYPYCRDIFAPLGHDVTVVDNKRNYLRIGGQTAWQYPRLLRAAGWTRWNDLVMNRRVVGVARAWRPDLVLLFKCENVRSRTIERLRQATRAVIINWDHDNPFWPTNTSMDLLRSIPLYDAFGSLAEHFTPVLESLGCPRVEYLPMFHNAQRLTLAKEPSAEDRERLGSDVLFVGIGTPERAAMLRRLVRWDLGVWGNWSGVRLAADDPLRAKIRGGYLDGESYAKALRCCKIAVNVLNTQCLGANNMRTFEAPGVGAFLLTEYSREQAERLFTDGEDIVCYRSADDLCRKVEHYLAHDEQRRGIAAVGQARVLREHTLEHRLRRILEVTEEVQAKAAGEGDRG